MTDDLKATVDKIVDIMLHRQTESEMPRMARWLQNALAAFDIVIDESGRPLPLSDAPILFDPLHPSHEEVFSKLMSHLPEGIRQDFLALRSHKGFIEGDGI